MLELDGRPGATYTLLNLKLMDLQTVRVHGNVYTTDMPLVPLLHGRSEEISRMI